MAHDLIEKIRMRNARTVVIGLGYVGAPLLALVHGRGCDVAGFDVDPTKVAALRARGLRVSDDPAEVIPGADVAVLCVPTPVDDNQRPDLTYVERAGRTLVEHLKGPALVILESTVAPGSTEECLVPILEASGLTVGEDLLVAHCPERIDPGNKTWDVHNLPRVVGATDPRGLEAATTFYQSILDSEIHPLSSVRAAEAVKIVENTFRDVNIAFVNELAMSFDKLGIDITEVIRGAATKPFGFLAHWPGAGVGGHCIAVDPYYLIARAHTHGFNHRFLKTAREINSAMPDYTVQKVLVGLNHVKRSVRGTAVAVLGVAYKPEVDDPRESPSLHIIEGLQRLGADLRVHDPFLPGHSTHPRLEDAIDGATCVVLATAHREYLAFTPERFRAKGVQVVIDGRNALDQQAFEEVGIVYEGIGRRHRGLA